MVVNGRRQETVDRVVERLPDATGVAPVSGVAADIGTADGETALFAALPQVGILINNAGIFDPKPFFDIPDEDWQRFYNVNMMIRVRAFRAYMPGILARMGADRLHLQRIQHPDADRGGDPLRHDQDGLAGDFARPGRTDPRH